MNDYVLTALGSPSARLRLAFGSLTSPLRSAYISEWLTPVGGLRAVCFFTILVVLYRQAYVLLIFKPLPFLGRSTSGGRNQGVRLVLANVVITSNTAKFLGGLAQLRPLISASFGALPQTLKFCYAKPVDVVAPAGSSSFFLFKYPAENDC